MRPMWKPAALAVALTLAAATARAQISTSATPVYHGTLRIRPADLRYPARFKNGAQAIDVYRTLVTGLDGTPMPSYAGVFEDPGTLWDLVAYLGSLAR